ncbi:Oidioi.mRNA.OKI2018_I69.XSR.g15885.t1.cds [Oikopleura dioica]|uniref:Oidioi.mRNA.OKI2018_I69.XSR.g15885.t1.cds n=1 Tax=Oikopleura dioica TaxID=34765 RepID=A0ABN7SEA4_OIKDI|nr:Oidioi.mRNA.OKI2018_I69.XSR.g15885.t1.cds [Oikopleura dioica]
MTSETFTQSGFKSSFQECPNSASSSVPPASYSNNFGPGISIQTLRDPSDQRFRFNLKKRSRNKDRHEESAAKLPTKEPSPEPPLAPEFVPPLPDYECPGSQSPPPEPELPPLPLEELPPDPDEWERKRHVVRCARRAVRIYKSRIDIAEHLDKVAADPSPKCSPCESPVISTPSTIGSIRRSITPDYSSRSSSRSSFSSRGSSYSRRSSYSRDRSYSSRSSRSRSYSVYFLLQRQL